MHHICFYLVFIRKYKDQLKNNYEKSQINRRYRNYHLFGFHTSGSEQKDS